MGDAAAGGRAVQMVEPVHFAALLCHELCGVCVVCVRAVSVCVCSDWYVALSSPSSFLPAVLCVTRSCFALTRNAMPCNAVIDQFTEKFQPQGSALQRLLEQVELQSAPLGGGTAAAGGGAGGGHGHHHHHAKKEA